MHLRDSFQSSCPFAVRGLSQHVGSPEVVCDLLHCLTFLGAVMVATGSPLWSKRQVAAEQSQQGTCLCNCWQASPMKVHHKTAMLRVKRLAEGI